MKLSLLFAGAVLASLLPLTASAQGRVDLVVVVDSSGSMAAEANQVQTSLNSFAQVLQASGVSLRLILISDDSTDAAGICLPAPLGSGGCPGDENLPTFRHVVTSVNSGDAFNTILGSYASWSGSLRTNARKAVLVVSDDNDGLRAEDFESQLLALDPSFKGFRFHAIVAREFDAMSDPCAFVAAAPGREYTELARRTRGRSYDLCFQSFTAYFFDLANQVIDQSKGGRFRRADRDGDGWGILEGDCQEFGKPGSPFPERVNPGAAEVAANGIDDDCNGVVDDVLPTCSTSTNFTPGPYDLARALDACVPTTESSGRWGVISAAVTLWDGTGVPDVLQSAVKTSFGGYLPRIGDTFVVLSTGTARESSDPGFVPPGCGMGDFGTDHGNSVPIPPNWVFTEVGCPQPGAFANDSIRLRLRIRVPTNATAMRFDHAFLASQWPDNCTRFNDTALALITEGAAQAIPPDGNVLFDATASPMSVQTATPTVCPDVATCFFAFLLQGTGFEDDYATTWQEVVVPVVPGAVMTLEFYLWDADSGLCDSTLLLDGLRFDLLP